jgi:hypothetical protein
MLLVSHWDTLFIAVPRAPSEGSWLLLSPPPRRPPTSPQYPKGFLAHGVLPEAFPMAVPKTLTQFLAHGFLAHAFQTAAPKP